MHTRKVVLIVLLSNLVIVSLLVGVFAFSQPAQAREPSAPAAATTIGPFYQMYSGADFVPYRFDFSITRDVYAVVRQSTFGVGVVGLHLPPGATITELLNDSDNTNGTTDLLLLACPLGQSSCSEVGRASQDAGGRAQKAVGLSVNADLSGNAYFLQVNLPNDSKFYYARVAYTLPSSALFMPAIAR